VQDEERPSLDGHFIYESKIHECGNGKIQEEADTQMAQANWSNC